MTELASVVATLQAEQANISASVAKMLRSHDAPDFAAKITSVQISATVPIWKYSWVEVEPDDFIGTNTDYTVRPVGRSGTNNAVNLLELGNTSGSAYGFSVAYAGGQWKLTAANFTNFVFHPIPVGSIVRMRVAYRPTSGTERFEFSAPNRIDGTC